MGLKQSNQNLEQQGFVEVLLSTLKLELNTKSWIMKVKLNVSWEALHETTLKGKFSVLFIGQTR